MLRIDFGHCLSRSVGMEHGLMEPELSGMQPRLNEAAAGVERLWTSGKLGFMDLPSQTDEARAIQNYARKVRGSFDTLVVLGIGGSALGNSAVQQALRPLYWNFLDAKARKGGMRLFVLDNVDPRWTADLLSILDLKKTLFNVISKSGTTAEILSNYFFFRDAVAKKVGIKKASKHFVITTDPQKGYLRELATREKIPSFSVPQNVGGRFSVLSSVGLLSAACTGINILDLLAGAQAMVQRCKTPSLKENPAAVYAAIQYLFYQKGKKLSVMMPYTQNLWGVADWYRQLWAESLGKKVDRAGKVIHAGPTPIKALGVTDQHSQAQLYMEGPFDKIISFLSVENFGKKTPIPAVDPKHYLSGRSLNELLKAEEQGTRAALTKAQRPSLTISVSEISPFTLGELFYMLELAVAYTGELMNINAFDQPGVELAKVYTYALMGRTGYESQRNELEEQLNSSAQGTTIV
jgi:glucose-6-phosphate isomerase